MKIYIDGHFYSKNDAKVSVFDHGLLYGDGVFEGMRVYNGRVFRLDEHLQRLEESARAIMISLPIPLKEIEKAVIETVRQNGLRDAYIRLLLTRGVGDLGLDLRKCDKGATLVIIVDKIALYPESFYEKGLELITCAFRQKSNDQLTPAVKSLNYLNNVLAREQATRAGAQEAILLNGEGYVTECSGDNIFYIRDGKIITPPTYVGILNGITRLAVIDLAREMGIEVTETLFSRFELYRADEVFLTGSGAEVIAAVKIDGHVIGQGRAGPLTKKLIKAFREHARSTGTLVFEEAKAR